MIVLIAQTKNLAEFYEVQICIRFAVLYGGRTSAAAVCINAELARASRDSGTRRQCSDRAGGVEYK